MTKRSQVDVAEQLLGKLAEALDTIDWKKLSKTRPELVTKLAEKLLGSPLVHIDARTEGQATDGLHPDIEVARKLAFILSRGMHRAEELGIEPATVLPAPPVKLRRNLMTGELEPVLSVPATAPVAPRAAVPAVAPVAPMPDKPKPPWLDDPEAGKQALEQRKVTPLLPGHDPEAPDYPGGAAEQGLRPRRPEVHTGRRRRG